MIQWILAIIVVEAVVEIVVESELFFKFRNFIYKNSEFFGKLISCGYCFSVWVSMPFAFVLPGELFQIQFDNIYGYLIDSLCKIFILHRLSNLFHSIINFMVNRYPIEFVVHLDNINELENDDG